MAAHHPRSELAAPLLPFERCFDDMYALLPFEVEGSNACSQEYSISTLSAEFHFSQ